MVMNGLFIALFIIVAYFVYKFFTDSASDAYLSGDPISASGTFDIAKPPIFTIADPDERPDFRIREGGDFAFSTWIYINSYSGQNAGKGKPVFVIADQGVATNYLLVGALYPNENKMMIRAFTGNTSDITRIQNFSATMQDGNMFKGENIVCDIQNVDMQRWISITVSVSGRIMDVYMDGKLTRSCILPDSIKASTSGAQAITMAQAIPGGGFPGSFSRIRFFNYAPTPDQIYANYQAGPYKGKGFFEYLGEQMGIKFTYMGAGGAQQVVGNR